MSSPRDRSTVRAPASGAPTNPPRIWAIRWVHPDPVGPVAPLGERMLLGRGTDCDVLLGGEDDEAAGAGEVNPAANLGNRGPRRGAAVRSRTRRSIGTPSLRDLEEALATHDGVVARAAAALGLTRQSTYRWIEKEGLDVARFRSKGPTR
jgi:hypothetical protein